MSGTTVRMGAGWALAPATLRYCNTVYWPERGLIHHEDQITGAYDSMSCRQALERVAAFRDILRNSRGVNRDLVAQPLYWKMQDFVDQMVVLIRIAQEQGQPSDASARRDLARRRAKTIAVSGVSF